MRGFINYDFAAEHYPAFLREVGAGIADGRIRYREDFVDGLEKAPEAFIGMLEGRNFGKLIVRVDRPDLRACELEDRLVPAIPDLGATVLTTGGYVLLLSPFPVIAADPFGQSGGPGFLTPSAMSGSAGVSGLLPGNSAGVPGLATTAPTGSNGGAAVTIIVGSGADDAGAANIPPVTRNTIANDALSAAPVIGRCRGTGPPSCRPNRSIGAACR